MQPEALGYIFRLFRIIILSLTSLYFLTSTGILISHKVVQYNLPRHAVVMDGTLKEIVVSSCTTWGMDNYMCSAKLHTKPFIAFTPLLIVYINQKFLTKYFIIIIVWVIQLFVI